MILQRLKHTYNESYSLAECYYSFLSAINGLKLTDREIKLMAFTAVHGSISNQELKRTFCEIHDTTPATINNMISKLKRMYLITKVDNNVVINPAIQLNFDKDVKLEISLVHRQAPNVVSEKLPD